MTGTIEATGDFSVQAKSRGLPVMAKTEEQLKRNDVTVRLIEIILKMSEEDQRYMLNELEPAHSEKKDISENRKPTFEDMREYPRKTSLIAVDCSTHNVCFTNFIHDISNGGVFIETNAPFYVGQKIAMNFTLPEIESPISVGGKVIRMNSEGIGVKFIEGDVHKLDIR